VYMYITAEFNPCVLTGLLELQDDIKAQTNRKGFVMGPL